MMTDLTRILSYARLIADKIYDSRNEHFVIISDRDADGQTSGAIMSIILDRLGIDYDIHFSNRTREDFEHVLDEFGRDNMFIFTDLGSGQAMDIRDVGFPANRVIIIDHHQVLPKRIFPYEFNANLFGINGATEVSGAGMAYLVARQFGYRDLSQLAIVGATGDMQNTLRGFIGVNREIIIPDALTEGVVKVTRTLNVYGRETRPLFVELTYLSEPKLFKSLNDSKYFLRKIGITKEIYELPLNSITDTGYGGRILTLLREELFKIFMRKAPLILKGYFNFLIETEGITFNYAPRNTEIRDAEEFSTLLNSANRLDNLETTHKMLIEFIESQTDESLLTSFPSSKTLRDARRTRENMSRILRKSIKRIENEIYERVYVSDFLVIFDLTDAVPPQTTGTIAQMLMWLVNPDFSKPVISFTLIDSDTVKFSMREPRILFIRGLDMAKSVSETAPLFGGSGGGHAPACGGFVPEKNFFDFVRALEKNLIRQAVEKNILVGRQ